MKRLCCSCCGGVAVGKQWFNRDTGYGICAPCVTWIRTRRKHFDENQFQLAYGKPGYNFAAPLAQGLERGMLVGWTMADGSVITGTLRRWDGALAVVSVDGREVFVKVG